MLDLTWWQVFALVGSAAVAVIGGRLLGAWVHRLLYRRVLLTRVVDDRFVLRMQAPVEALGIVVVWQVLVGFGDYPPSVVAFCRNVGHIGLLVVLGFAVGPLLVLLAIVGAAVALASHRPLENVLAAYAILGDHGIREGDTVRLDSGVVGDIDAIGLYSTRIRTGEGSYVIIPNRRLADAQIERSVVQADTHVMAAVPPPNGLRSTSPGGIS